MERIRFFIGISLCLVIASAQNAIAQNQPRFDHVIFVVLENTNYSEAVKQPFLSQLAAQGVRFDHFQGVAHPSEPNYVALTSGDLNGVRNDGIYNIDAPHIGDLLEAKNLTWKVYAEGYPGNCYLGKVKGTYYRKHNPFISYVDVQSDPQRCANIVEAGQMDADIQSGALPNYALYIPDINNDGHDTDASYADQFLSRRFGPLLQNPNFTKGLLLVITFDESDHDGEIPNHVLTVMYGESVRPGSVSSQTLNHYSLLRMVEDNFGLGNLGKQDAYAAVIDGVWKQASSAVLSVTAPNDSLTPGVLCTINDPNFSGYEYPEKIARCKRNIKAAEKMAVAKTYGSIPRSEWRNYEFDHLIPLCAGGSNDQQNLWPQPIAEAHKKDLLEDQICAAMKQGTMTQAQAVQKVHDWFHQN